MYILEDGGVPVSMAGSSRQLPRGRAVGPVYTPPYLRGRGYATASVALLSRIILEKGNDYCALFTDLANPVSNSIYQKIGYQPICDFREIKFR
jgi:predicted GNAT family acetyltransferase